MSDIVVQFRGTIYENGYGQISQKVMRDKSIHAIAKAIYGYLVSFAGQEGSAFPSVQLMMDELGIKSDDTFYKYRRQLTDAGYITIEQQQRIKGQFYNNVYIIELIPQPYPKNSGTVPYPISSSTVESSTTKSGITNNRSLKETDLNNKHKTTTALQELNAAAEQIAPTKESTEQNDVVVVSETIKEQLNTTIKMSIVASWIEKYGREYVLSKLSYIATNASKYKNPAGTLRTAVEQDWDVSALKNTHSSKDSQKDVRYPGFYELFPDA